MSNKVSEVREVNPCVDEKLLKAVEKAEAVSHMKFLKLKEGADINTSLDDGWDLSIPRKGVLFLFNTKTHDSKVVENADEILKYIVHHHPGYDQLRLVKTAS